MMAAADVRRSPAIRILVVFGIVVVGVLLGLAGEPAAGQAPPAKKAGKAADKPGPKADKQSAKSEPVGIPPQVAEIDKQIEAQWKANHITPSAQASDYEFIRRVTLDLIGRIATIDEIRQFIVLDKGTPQARRARLIERLLESPAYAENWASMWSVWLLTRSSPRDQRTGQQIYRVQLETWLYDQFADKGHGWDQIVYDLLTATGATNENGAVNYVLAHVGENIAPDRVREEGRFNFVPLTSRTTRLFLGLQTQCTQCHNHKSNDQWKQKHFWGISALFRQVERVGGGMMRGGMMDVPKLELKENPGLNASNIIYFESAQNPVGLATRPTFLDGTRYDPKAGKTRRQFLAEFVTHDPNFAKAYVNRMWGHFFSRGLTVNGKDIDDFGEHNAETHPLTEDTAKAMKVKYPDKFKDKEPTLLDYLADEFRSSPTNHDPRALIRWICNSRAYSLTSVANGSIEITEDKEVGKNGDKKVAVKKVVPNDHADAEPFFSRMQLKSMSPEQLFESLWVSTYANPRAVTKKTKDDQKRLRNEWMRRLTVNFGDDEGNETTFNGTVVQALMLMNGQEINQAIEDEGGPVPVAMVLAGRRGGLPAVVDELYLATLNRRATREEIVKISKDMSLYLTNKRDDRFVEKAGQDLLWAILNSSEFILNH